MFSRNAILLAAYVKATMNGGGHSSRGRLVRGGLTILAGHAVEFDRNVRPDPRLQEHFLHILTSPPNTCDELWWLELFEDIALFVREKTLRCGGIACMAERAILRHFERCGEWSPDDGTLVSFLYWHDLPGRCGCSGSPGGITRQG